MRQGLGCGKRPYSEQCCQACVDPLENWFEALQFRKPGMVSGGGKQINYKLRTRKQTKKIQNTVGENKYTTEFLVKVVVERVSICPPETPLKQ